MGPLVLNKCLFVLGGHSGGEVGSGERAAGTRHQGVWDKCTTLWLRIGARVWGGREKAGGGRGHGESGGGGGRGPDEICRTDGVEGGMLMEVEESEMLVRWWLRGG